MFVFDETFRTLQAQGGGVNLARWYSQTSVSILHAAFTSREEEVVLVDSTAEARIFSFVTMQFRCVLIACRRVACSLLTDAWKAGYVTASIASQLHIFVTGWILLHSPHSQPGTVSYCVPLGDIWLLTWDSYRRSQISSSGCYIDVCG
jgi:hypothetical protein